MAGAPLVTKAAAYLQESLEELRHVRWPTHRQAVRLSVIVLGFTAVTTAIFGVLDFILSKITAALLSLSL